MQFPVKFLAAAALAATLAACASMPPSSSAPVAWVQFGQGDQPDLIARALIGTADSCPSITVDGATSLMPARVSPRAAAFGRMCELRLKPESVHRIQIAYASGILLDQEIVRQPERIAVFGDTGCRVTSYFDQGCNDPKKWPFEQLARAVAGKNPDYVLHLGDYLYREVPCLGSSRACGGGPFGDREETWRLDFFEPARPLLAKAPWVFVRGNHEDCKRGGYGWSYYFGDSEAACEIAHKPAHIRLGGLTLVNFDSAHADEDAAPVVRQLNQSWAELARDMKARKPDAPGAPILLMSHEPAYFACSDNKRPIQCLEKWVEPISGVRNIADAARANGWRTILLSGHVHAFETFDLVPVSLGGGRSVTQLVVGTGGANSNALAPVMMPPDAIDFRFDDWRRVPTGDPADRKTEWKPRFVGSAVGKAQGRTGFGFGILAPASLELTMFDESGARLFACNLADEKGAPRCR